MISSNKVTELLYADEELDFSPLEYEKVGRNAMLDYELRMRDIGDIEKADKIKKMVKAFDKKFKFKL